MAQPSIFLVSYHFYPSNEIGARRPTALAQFLVTKGLRVRVVSAFGSGTIEPGSEVLPGVVAIPVRRPSRRFLDFIVFLKRRIFHSKTVAALREASAPPQSLSGGVSRPSLWARTREFYFRVAYFVDEYKTWGYLAAQAAVRSGKEEPAALVLSSSPPPTVLCAGTLIAQRLHVPHIVDMRDPWTDAIASLHPDRSLELALSRTIEGWVMRSAAAITSTGSNVADLLIRRQPELAARTFVVRNGYDGAVRSAALATGGRLAILFAGELYLNRDPYPLLHAIERLLHRPEVNASRVSLTFMGRKTEHAGRSFASWLENKRCAAVVKFMPPQPPEAVAQAYLEATVLLNLAQHQPLSVPAKTFEHLASGRENLLLCEDESESAQLVAKIPGVIQVDPRNSEALDRVLLDLYERHVNQGRLQTPAEHDVCSYSRAAANETFWRIMTSIVAVDRRQDWKESAC